MLSIINKIISFQCSSLGIMQNLVDLLNTKILCWRPSTVNWRKEYEIDDLKNIRSFHKKNENMINI
jgi:hypothetical protein